MSDKKAYTYSIITDGFSNLPGAVLRTLDIHILPCTYFVDDVAVDYNGDIETFDGKISGFDCHKKSLLFAK